MKFFKIQFSALLYSIVFFVTYTISTHCATHESNVHFYDSDLFKDVQLKSVFRDSKTFVDCIPKHDIDDIVESYQKVKDAPDFDLHEFVRLNFDQPVRPTSDFTADNTLSMQEHLTRLWPVLTRKADEKSERSSIISLPYDYVVPGGRFSEIYYWDSYFTILGLKAQKHYTLIQNMVNNFAYLIDTLGFIPNGNRDYYLTRSQPPFFSLMIKELEAYDSMAADHYLEEMTKEYDFWMDGANALTKPGDAKNHVVMMNNGSILNRYYDKETTPRPESYKEDYILGQQHKGDKKKFYRDIRSAAESGWDFSSRWFSDGKTMESIHTTDIIPVDLNCLLAHLEKMIAAGHLLRNNIKLAADFDKRWNLRRDALLTYCWNAERNFFMDYDFVLGKNTEVKSLAGVFPLFLQLVDQDKADKVALILEAEFLKPGGVITTLTDTDQQWDAPNGWAPLQWVTYRGLKNYKIDKLADEIRTRWLRQNERVYKATGKMMEKYNVMDTTLLAGGGEYPNQDGFGWTNGVAIALEREKGR